MASLLRRCITAMRAPANELAFAVRAGLCWQRGRPSLGNEDKSRLFVGGDGRSARAERLAADFDLADLRGRSTVRIWTANLALLENLERLTARDAVPCGQDGVVRAIDVGSGDFHYATALHRWLSRGDAEERRRVVLRGFEIDGHGIYRDGHSRADHARAHAALAARGADEVRYEVADAAHVRLPAQDAATLLFPFLSAYPALAWGMPLSRWRPRRLLQRVVVAVRPGGWLVVANQTGAEFACLQQLMAGLPVALVRRRGFATDLVPHAERTADQVGSLWLRHDG